MPFGIPCPDDSLDQAYSTLPDEQAANEKVLTDVMLAIVADLGTSLQLNQQVIQQCANTVTRSLRQQIKRNDTVLNEVQAPMAESIGQSITDNQQLIDLSQALVSEVEQPVTVPVAVGGGSPEAEATPPPGESAAAPPAKQYDPRTSNSFEAGYWQQLPDSARGEVSTRWAELFRQAGPDADQQALFNQAVHEHIDSRRARPAASPQAMPRVSCADMLKSLPPLPPELEHGIPLPGDEHFCRFADAVGQWLSSLVGGLLSITEKYTDPDWIGDSLIALADQDKSSTGWWGTLLRGMASAVRALKPLWSAACYTIGATIKYARQLFPQWADGIGAAASVWAIKAVLSNLKKIRYGSDAGVWITGDLLIQFTTVETVLDRLEVYYTAAEPPFAEEATEAWIQGRVSKDWRDCVWRLWGKRHESYEPFARTRLPRVTAAELIAYGRREGWEHNRIVELLHDEYFHDHQQVNRVLTLYDELPTISDHLAWLRKNIQNRDYVERYQLERGFPEFWQAFGDDLRAQGMRKQDAQHHFEAHWQFPSPEQMREMVYRLRPGAPNAKGVEFTDTDFKNILREQDYNPVAVDWFAATLYRLPALTYIISMYRGNVIKEGELKQYHLDLGYNDRDSDRFVGIDQIVKARYRADRSHGFNPAAIAKAFIAGRMPASEVTSRMDALGWTAEEASDLMKRARSDIHYQAQARARSRVLTRTITQVAAAIRVGILSGEDAAATLEGVGWTAAQSAAIVRLESATARTERVRHAIAHLRSAFHDGEIDADYVRSGLHTLGVIDEAIEGYVSTWALENTPRRRRLTASQIKRELAEGTVSQEDALARLTNLGYDDADRQLFLADAQRQLVDVTSAFTAANQLSGRSRAKVLAQLHGKAGKLSKRLVSVLRQQEPVGTLKKWAAAGVISPSYFASRLRIYGYDDSTIDNYLHEIDESIPLSPLQPDVAPAAVGGGGLGAAALTAGNGEPPNGSAQ